MSIPAVHAAGTRNDLPFASPSSPPIMAAEGETPAPAGVSDEDERESAVAAIRAAMRVAQIGEKIGHLASDEVGIGRLKPSLMLVQGLVSCLPYLAAKRLRAALYRLAHVSIGPKTVIYGKITMFGEGDIARRLTIGTSCRINSPCRIDLSGPVTIGDNVSLGYGVSIVTASHDMNDPTRRAGKVNGLAVTIGSGAWVAANVHILPGVTIGEGAVIGAASVVTRDIPPHTLAVGSPAKVVRELPHNTQLSVPDPAATR